MTTREQELIDRAHATMKKQYRIMKEQQVYLAKALAMNAELALNLYPHTTTAKNEPIAQDSPWDGIL
jgi:hypothetical protein